jgi:hypothetical protein
MDERGDKDGQHPEGVVQDAQALTRRAVTEARAARAGVLREFRRLEAHGISWADDPVPRARDQIDATGE